MEDSLDGQILFYKCSGYGRFIRWANPEDSSRIIRRENGRNEDEYPSHDIRALIHEVRDVKKIAAEMNNRIVYVLMFMVALVVLVAVK